MRSLSAIKLLRIAALCTIVSMSGAALAQGLAPGPIRLVVPNAPGGGSDIYARLLGQGMSAVLNQPVIVENNAGGSGIIALTKVAQAPKDGNTLVLTTSTAISAVPNLYKKLPYKVDDFAAVAMVAKFPIYVYAHPSVPARTFPELVAYVKANPNKLNYGHAGQGSIPHLVTELVKAAAGLDIVGIPYKGSGPVMTDLAAGQLQVYMDVASPAMTFANAGKLTVLAIMDDKRSALTPAVPTMKELGYPGLEAFQRYSLLAPAGTPPSVIALLHKAALKAMESGPLHERQIAEGSTPGPVTPEALNALLVSDFEMWGRVVRRLGLTLE